MNKVLTAMVFIVAGAIFFSWCDLFHLTVGLPLLVGKAILLRGWKKRMQLEEEEEEEEFEEEGLGHQIIVGALGGCLSLLLLAGGFSAASRMGLSDLFYGRDCPDILKEVSILEEGNAYRRIVQIIEERLQYKISSTCRGELTERKVRALIEWAEQLRGKEQVSKLRKALQEAEDIVNHDLVKLITTKLQAVEQVQLIQKQQQEIDKNMPLLEKLKESQLTPRETERGVVVNFPDILFKPGMAVLTAAALVRVKKIADIFNHDAQGRKVLSEGHTDSTGSEEENQVLSQDRAESVARALVKYGVSRERLVVRGYGEKHPIDSNNTHAGRAKNRRVEIIIQN